ncbi:MAG TPA: UDP-glucose 4-epimerase GalE [Rhizomicrobium sp.]|jgi:UDP-glucose 4-epimerase|nr:UDP-glucose 4-epimerase GalE [Rhizomicrobium sp.]
MSVLVTGGAGYIGSHMVWELLDRGEDVVVLDNLTTGVRGLVAEKAQFVEGNAGDGALVRKLIRDHKVDALIHFAGSIVVPESVEKPLKYYVNNTGVARRLLEACVATGMHNFIFSSTAAVYGVPAGGQVAETMPTMPINPYGRSKLMTEWMLEDTARAHDFRYVALRYFNVAGADPKGRTGQSTPRATHLIKRACQVALGRVPELTIFGTDYPTADGTGVRDYIHVSDLVAAHALALDHLRGGGAPAIFNCGYGRGFSVRDVIGAVERVSGQKVATSEHPRRAGDPPTLIADAARIRTDLGWQPQHENLDEIVRTAYAWESRLNDAG